MIGGIMLQGTASNVGKSVLATALCRIFKQDGFRVAPFKSWNMALNSFVTEDGGEIGRGQGDQAMACMITATNDMNPVLVKPRGDGETQVFIRGRPWKNRKTGENEKEYRDCCLEVISASLQELKKQYEILVIEGAGSPAEINLKEGDLANMKVAHLADVPVIIVADIDRGGALASAVGTMMLLTPEERERVAGLIFNKFRGDLSILEPGLHIVEEKTGKPVLGVVPYVRGLNLAAEDEAFLDNDASGSVTNYLLVKQGLSADLQGKKRFHKDRVDCVYDRIAGVVRESLNMEQIYENMGVYPRR